MKYDIQNYEWVEDVAIDRDDNFIILSNDDLLPRRQGGAIITKISPSFEVLQRRAYDNQEYFYWYHVVPLDDGSYLATGDAG